MCVRHTQVQRMLLAPLYVVTLIDFVQTMPRQTQYGNKHHNNDTDETDTIRQSSKRQRQPTNVFDDNSAYDFPSLSSLSSTSSSSVNINVDQHIENDNNNNISNENNNDDDDIADEIDLTNTSNNNNTMHVEPSSSIMPSLSLLASFVSSSSHTYIHKRKQKNDKFCQFEVDFVLDKAAIMPYKQVCVYMYLCLHACVYVCVYKCVWCMYI